MSGATVLACSRRSGSTTSEGSCASTSETPRTRRRSKRSRGPPKACRVGCTGGSGQASSIAAGPIPSLDAGLRPGRERWAHVSMRPGEHPMDELRRAFSVDADEPLEAAIGSIPAHGRLVVVVDQFEETFTTCGDETERAAFIGALT